ncbi:ribonuclease III [Lyngbya confervoides]|uniref:Ribonuclease 3 n=1 Tax=Lyngbya confervoides BDU141951 TaxID=1574623 RepID=A0ABD4T6Y7_9CYAN|nr:ribonuclease III [Lyngbya confervoides]MCM1984337.1 ribonuclease III [Lyngbya confervoides BDU141951]
MADVFPPRTSQLQRLVARLGISEQGPVRWDLLDLALTHPSAHPTDNYEQLEFIGDAVVRLVASRLLWAENHQGQVGEWSAIRAVLVSDRTLAELAQSIGLEKFLRVGSSAVGDRKGETSRLADAFEAVLAALFLSSQTLELILPWLEPLFVRSIAKIRSDPAYQNYKAALQQWTQLHYQQLPEYRVQSLSSPGQSSADLTFQAEVWFQDRCLGQGQGHSRKAAEKAAAKVAYEAILHEQSER